VLSMRSSQRGLNIVEIMISLVVLGVLIGLGAPGFAEWLQNQQIRAAAEATLNGLQVARGGHDDRIVGGRSLDLPDRPRLGHRHAVTARLELDLRLVERLRRCAGLGQLGDKPRRSHRRVRCSH